MSHVPDNHPRAKSLKMRDRLVEGMHRGVVTETGMIAHGRGEAFDYLLGEKTHPFAITALETASAMLILARHPVISINGNVAALAFEELVQLERGHPKLRFEVNVFHFSRERAEAIVTFLQEKGMKRALNSAEGNPEILAELQSARRLMHQEGIAKADVVLVGLEDGDRCEALIASGRKVIVIDLNPLSRSAQKAHVTIVDEVTRALALLNQQIERDADQPPDVLQNRIQSFSQRETLELAVTRIRSGV